MIRVFAAGVLNGYAAVLFLDGTWRGFIILLATFIKPAIGLGGLLGAVTAVTAALCFGYPRDLVKSGLYTVNPLLVGMTVAFFTGLTPAAVLLIVPAALFTMVLATVLGDWLYRNWRLGALSLPFTIVATLVALAFAAPGARPALASLPLPDAVVTAASAGAALLPADMLDLLTAFCRSLGAIFFLPETGFGLLLFLLLFAASRVMAVQALLGFLTGCYCFLIAGGEEIQLTYGMAGFNFCLTAIALGGHFFLPGRAATLHALAATTVTTLLALLAARLLAPHGLPVFAWPFNLAIIPWVAALHLRQAARPPRSAADLPGPPETAHARAALIARLAWERVVLRLPVVGEWTVTQDHDDHPTHLPPWSHAFDFEVLDDAGFPFRVAPGTAGDASRAQAALDSHFCFAAPVVTAADGMVVAARDGVVDNLPGTVNTTENFGNYLIIRHAEGFCSLYAHLQCRSLQVAYGEIVRAGQAVARCGASGRAPRPHLHFHLQSDHVPGSPTFAAPFSQFARRLAGENARHYVAAGLPARQDRVITLDTIAGARPAPRLTPGQRWRFAVTAGRRTWTETWLTDVDLWGNIRVRADRPAAELYLRCDLRGLAAVAFSGSRRGALYRFFLGNSLLPAFLVPGLPWSDNPGALHTLPRALALPLELFLPFAEPAGPATAFTCANSPGVGTAVSAAERGRTTATLWSANGMPRELAVTRNERALLHAVASD